MALNLASWEVVKSAGSSEKVGLKREVLSPIVRRASMAVGMLRRDQRVSGRARPLGKRGRPVVAEAGCARVDEDLGRLGESGGG